MFTVLIRHGMMHGTDLMYCRQSAEKQLKRVATASAAVRVHQLLSYLYSLPGAETVSPRRFPLYPLMLNVAIWVQL